MTQNIIFQIFTENYFWHASCILLIVIHYEDLKEE